MFIRISGHAGIRLDLLEIVMAIRTADPERHGDLAHGSGHMRFGSGAFDGPYDFRSRMGAGKGTNPEELLGAAMPAASRWRWRFS